MRGWNDWGHSFPGAHDWEDDNDLGCKSLQTALLFREDRRRKGSKRKMEQKKDFDGNCWME
uniref:Uncharacterized protein n=1 Tax=Onchocerca volvulus TaxID=6282 RepID=A0A8R1XYY5_ONCVO